MLARKNYNNKRGNLVSERRRVARVSSVGEANRFLLGRARNLNAGVMISEVRSCSLPSLSDDHEQPPGAQLILKFTHEIFVV